jgi:hypothetical protein
MVFLKGLSNGTQKHVTCNIWAQNSNVTGMKDISPREEGVIACKFVILMKRLNN